MKKVNGDNKKRMEGVDLNEFSYKYCGLYLDMVLQIFSCVIEVDKSINFHLYHFSLVTN
jgi:hypothetical protein